jgi:hypothetical protein
MRKKKPVPKAIVCLDPPWAEGKLPPPPAKGWSLPELHAAARAAGDIVRRAECGFVTATYWLLGQYLLLAKKLAASDADYKAWKIALGIPDWRLSRAIGFAAVYKTQEAASKATIKEAEDRVRAKRAADGKKVHGSRFSLQAKVTQAEQAVTAIEVGLPKVKDGKILAVEIRRLRDIAETLSRLLAKYGPKIAAA